MKASSVIPASLASLGLAHAASSPSVYILMPSGPALVAVSSALTTLGYKHTASMESIGGGGGADFGPLDPSTFAVLALGSGTAYMNISRANPEARFILPSSKVASHAWIAQADHDDADADSDSKSVRAFFAAAGSGSGSASQLLELDVLAHGSHDQAQSWVALCDFLGLGYSVVERLKLWRFPQ